MIGQQFGPYEIVDVIGRGGMATVYRAWEPTVDRYVALKVLSHDILEDPNLLKRFQREARTVANLEHRAIVPVYAFGEHDGQPYIAMRYLDAGTLRKKLYYEEVTLGEAGRLIAQTAEALDYAHQRGVIHRDLKPSNILLDSVGNAYLTDFGIARILGSTSQITEGSGVIGTPSYMSPEQCQGKTLGPASDIYALGAILFEIVTGRTPYQADAPLTVMYMHVRDPIPSVRAIDPTLPEALEAVLMQALAKKPQDRFPTAGALAEAFNHAIHQPLGAPPPSQTPPPGVPIRARPPVPETDPSKELYIGPPTGYSEPVVDDLDDEPKPSGEGVRPPISGRTFAASFLGFVLLVGLIGGGVLLANSIQDEGRGLAAEPTLPPTVTPTSIDIVVTSIPTRGESTTIPVVEPSITPSATVTLSGIATATPSFTPGTAPVQPTNTPRPTTAVQPTALSLIHI
ncbi:MAG: serine/threonine protein kinase, partial [Chloroflexi bacterium]|nr:serine/threonine protein kinase [Chloroflexota bacterium]